MFVTVTTKFVWKEIIRKQEGYIFFARDCTLPVETRGVHNIHILKQVFQKLEYGGQRIVVSTMKPGSYDISVKNYLHFCSLTDDDRWQSGEHEIIGH